MWGGCEAEVRSLGEAGSVCLVGFETGSRTVLVNFKLDVLLRLALNSCFS